MEVYLQEILLAEGTSFTVSNLTVRLMKPNDSSALMIGSLNYITWKKGTTTSMIYARILVPCIDQSH